MIGYDSSANCLCIVLSEENVTFCSKELGLMMFTTKCEAKRPSDGTRTFPC